MPYVVFIAGASGSGKSVLAKKLEEEIQEQFLHISVSMLSMDHYYKPRPLSVKTTEEIKTYQQTTNFDVPDAIDFDLFRTHVGQLVKGKKIDRPVFSFELSDRAGTVEMKPTDIIIIEGLFAHHDLSRLKLKPEDYSAVFVESDNYFNYRKRRSIRDPKERNHTVETVIEKDKKFIGPAFFKYIAPAASRYAMIRVTNNFKHVAEADEKSKKAEAASVSEEATDLDKSLPVVLADIQEKTRDRFDWAERKEAKAGQRESQSLSLLREREKKL